MVSTRATFGAILVLMGVGWGLTQPLGKIAASSGHGAYGLVVWQQVVCVIVLGAISLARGRGLRFRAEALRFYLVVAVLGTVIPGMTFYTSIARLPSGIMSILISTIPLMAFPMALLLGLDRFSWKRVLGLLLGLAGVCLIALPQTSLPDPAMVGFLPLALLGPLCYALEGTYVSRFGTGGMDAVQAMFGAALMGLILCLPIMIWQGQGFVMPIPPGPAEWALIASSAIHGLLYACYVWLAARAGAVFAAQTSYIVTASGVVWAMVLLGERFSPWVWAAAAVMLLGLSLVQPRPRAAGGGLQSGEGRVGTS